MQLLLGLPTPASCEMKNEKREGVMSRPPLPWPVVE